MPEAVAWLGSRHTVALRPELAEDVPALRKTLYNVRGLVLPRKLVVTRELLDFAPALRVVARVHSGTDDTDLDACRERGVRVIQTLSASVRSNAEYLLGALLMLYRRGMFEAMSGERGVPPRPGRELQGSTVGLLGLGPTAHALAQLLGALGVRMIGYDPAVHRSAAVWDQLHVEPVGLRELMAQADAVSVQMMFASRYRHFVNDHMLAHCRAGQFWVGTSRSSLFDAEALARALSDGRIAACMLDGAERGFASRGSPLHGCANLHLTPRLGSHTQEALLRSSWFVAHRLHEAVMAESLVRERPSAPMELEPTSATTPSQWGEPDLIIR